MITQNEDRNRKTKYGHKREGNTGHGKHRSDTNPVFRNSNNISATISVFDMGISDEEWESLQKALDWPGPGKEITQLNLSTLLWDSKIVTKWEKKISLVITARDHNNNVKRYGGDFFHSKNV